MITVEEIINDEQINIVHANANFGGVLSNRDIVNQGVLKCACGYYQGHTSTQIIKEHGLVDKDYKITRKGQEYLWAAFRKEISV